MLTFEEYTPAPNRRAEQMKEFLNKGIASAVPLIDGKPIPAHKAGQYRNDARKFNIDVYAKGETTNGVNRVVFMTHRGVSYIRA